MVWLGDKEEKEKRKLCTLASIVGGRKMRRDGYDGYGYAGGKSSLSAPMG